MTYNSEYSKLYYQKNRIKLLAKSKRYQKPKALRKNKERYTERYLLQRARNNARARELDFNLEVEDIIIPDVCPYLHIPLLSRKGIGRQFDAPSVDRIDPNKGYIKGNIQILSDLANRMKSNSTQEQLLTFATNVLKLHG